MKASNQHQPNNSQSGATQSEPTTQKSNIFMKVLRPRDHLLAELRDIGLVGGLYGFILFTAGDHFLAAAIAAVFSPPSLNQDNITALVNLVKATFPLTVGTVIITGCIVSKVLALKSPWRSFILVCIIVYLSTGISGLLGLGGISGTVQQNIFSDHYVYTYTCHTVYLFPTHFQLCSVKTEQYVHAVAIYLFPFVAIPLFWNIYGPITFISAIVTGVYIGWALFYKLGSHSSLFIGPKGAHS